MKTNGNTNRRANHALGAALFTAQQALYCATMLAIDFCSLRTYDKLAEIRNALSDLRESIKHEGDNDE